MISSSLSLVPIYASLMETLNFVVPRLWLLAARRQNQLRGGEHRIHCLAPRHLSPDRSDPVVVVVAARKVYDDAGHGTPSKGSTYRLSGQ